MPASSLSFFGRTMDWNTWVVQFIELQQGLLILLQTLKAASDNPVKSLRTE